MNRDELIAEINELLAGNLAPATRRSLKRQLKRLGNMDKKSICKYCGAEYDPIFDIFHGEHHVIKPIITGGIFE